MIGEGFWTGVVYTGAGWAGLSASLAIGLWKGDYDDDA
jgi:hypothetical protein